MDKLQAENVQLKAENAELKTTNVKLKARVTELEGQLQHAAEAQGTLLTAVGGLNVVAVDAAQRAHVAESMQRNTNQIHNLEAKIKAFEEEAQALRSENNSLRTRNKALDERCKLLEEANQQLESHVKSLQSRVKSLEADVLNIKTCFETRDAMRDLEWFICNEVALAAGWTKPQIRKQKVYNFQRLLEERIDVPETTPQQMVMLIKHYKGVGTKIAHGSVTEAGVRSSMEDEEDDEEDKALKEQMIQRLSAYYLEHKLPFGGPVKRK